MGTRLYVGNLSFDSTEETLTAAFSQDSRQVSSVTIMTDRETGQSRGFGFIEMASEGDAQAAIEAMLDDAGRHGTVALVIDMTASGAQLLLTVAAERGCRWRT